MTILELQNRAAAQDLAYRAGIRELGPLAETLFNALDRIEALEARVAELRIRKVNPANADPARG